MYRAEQDWKKKQREIVDERLQVLRKTISNKLGYDGQLEPPHFDDEKIEAWKGWHTEFALCQAFGLNISESARLVNKTRQAVYKVLECPRMKEAIAYFLGEEGKGLTLHQSNVGVLLKQYAVEAAYKLIDILKTSTSERNLLMAIKLFFESLGMLKGKDAKGGDQNVTIVLDKSVRESMERLGVVTNGSEARIDGPERDARSDERVGEDRLPDVAEKGLGCGDDDTPADGAAE